MGPLPDRSGRLRRVFAKVDEIRKMQNRIDAMEADAKEFRRDVMQHLRDLVVKGEVGDDEERRAEQQVQKLTDEHTKSIDDLLKVKEAEIMEV